MNVSGKSELLGRTFRFIGYLHSPHPLGTGKLQMTFFEQIEAPKRWIICLSDVTKKQAKAFKGQLKKQLGKVVEAGEVIPYAQRSIDGDCNYDQFKEIVKEGFDGKPTWWEK